MSSLTQQRDSAEARSIRDARMEAARARCIKLKRDEPDMQIVVLSQRVGAAKSTVVKWLRDAGLMPAPRPRRSREPFSE